MMSRPTATSWELLKRIGRYLKGRPRLVWKYAWQSQQEVLDAHTGTPPDGLEAHSDANWAGCRRTRKSTSGGTVALGTHLIKAYSKTQAVIAKSSGESELYGVVRASTETLGISTLMEDFGLAGVRARVGLDANAAMGIVQRRGLNKLRHVEVDVLWIQEQQARRLLPLRKVAGPRNPSDMMTKNVPVAAMEVYLEQLSLVYKDGRAKVAQQLHSVGEIGEVATWRADDRRRNSATGIFATSEARVARGLCATRPDGSTAEGKKAKAEERHVDSWSKKGQGGRWTRVHRSARRALFTPFRVGGGPAKGQ